MAVKLSRMEARKAGISVPAGAFSREPHEPDMERRFKLKPEERLSIQCADLLRARAREDVLWFHLANEAQRSRASWAVQMAMGFAPGAADFLVLHVVAQPSRPPDPELLTELTTSPIWIELKCGRRTLTPDQKTFREAVCDRGMPFYVCRTLGDFQYRLDLHGVLK